LGGPHGQDKTTDKDNNNCDDQPVVQIARHGALPSQKPAFPLSFSWGIAGSIIA
jgi:hypothetical protein